MSSIIRAVRSPWLAMPPSSSNDAPVPANANTYRLAQIAIEAAERAQQRQVDRMIRAGRSASPLPSISVSPMPEPRGSGFVFNLPIN